MQIFQVFLKVPTGLKHWIFSGFFSLFRKTDLDGLNTKKIVLVFT